MSAKSVVKGLLERSGFEVSRRQAWIAPGRATQRGSLQQLSHLGCAPATVIDVGAADGTPPLYEVFPSARHILVEPLEEFAPTLRSWAARLGRADVVIAAAGAEPGIATLNVHPDLVGSSMMRESEDSDVNGVERQVELVTLDSLVDRFDAPGPYVVKVDTQGSELEVLKGGLRRVLPATDAVLLEVSLFQFFAGGPLALQVLDWMAQLGFAIYDIADPQYRPLDGALSQVDMLFVRDDGSFRRHHQYATSEQRRQQNDRIRPRL